MIDQLAATGKSYVSSSYNEYIHVQKAESYFLGVGDEELEPIRALLAGTKAFGDEGIAVDGVVKVKTEVKDGADREIKLLRQEQEIVLECLSSLTEYRPHLARLLHLRYVLDHSVEHVARDLHISRRTYDRWRAEALQELGEIIKKTLT